MPCLCATNTLKLFIRAVAHFDLLPRTTQPTHGALKCLTLPQQPRQQQFSTTSIYHSSSSSQSSYSYSTALNDPSKKQPIERSSFELGSGGSGDAFVELSPETIEALAEESRAPFSKFTYDGTRETTVSSTTSLLTSVRLPLPYSKGLSQGKSAQVTSHSTRRERGAIMNGYTDSLPAYRKYPDDINGTPSAAHNESGQNYLKDGQPPIAREPWQVQKAALRKKFQDGWNPMKRLSPDALTGIRALHAQMPKVYTTAMLADHFKISPEAVRRILKSKWSPGTEEEIDRQRRWFKRGEQVWTRWGNQGIKPPSQWRAQGVAKGYYAKKRLVQKSVKQRNVVHGRQTSKTSQQRTDDIPWDS